MNRRTIPLVAAVIALSSFVGVAPIFAQNNAPNNTPVSLTGQGADSRVSVNLGLTLEYVVHEMLEKAGVSYIMPAFTTQGTVKFHDVPFATALTQILGAAVPPMTYRIENGIYIIYPKSTETPAPLPPTAAAIERTPRLEQMVTYAPDSSLVSALRRQEAQMEIKRDVALAAKVRDAPAIRQMDAELKAVRSAIVRRAPKQIVVVDRASPVTAEYQQLLRLRQQRAALIAADYRIDSKEIKELNSEILHVTRLMEIKAAR